MVHVNVKFGTAPFELLSFGQVIWHQVMSAKIINTKLFLQIDIHASFDFYLKFTKAELPQEGILFCTQFPSLGVFINKKVGFQKN